MSFWYNRHRVLRVGGGLEKWECSASSAQYSTMTATCKASDTEAHVKWIGPPMDVTALAAQKMGRKSARTLFSAAADDSPLARGAPTAAEPGVPAFARTASNMGLPYTLAVFLHQLPSFRLCICRRCQVRTHVEGTPWCMPSPSTCKLAVSRGECLGVQ